jgi:hypothetical protein
VPRHPFADGKTHPNVGIQYDVHYLIVASGSPVCFGFLPKYPRRSAEHPWEQCLSTVATIADAIAPTVAGRNLHQPAGFAFGFDLNNHRFHTSISFIVATKVWKVMKKLNY